MTPAERSQLTAAPALQPAAPAAGRGELDLPPRASALVELYRFRQLIGMLVVRELKVRYKRSFFGLLWTMLNPLLLMVVYTIVFTTILPASLPNFSVFLLSALLPWLYFSTALMQGLNSVLANQELIRKVRLPQAVFPLSVVGSNLVNFALSLLPLFLVMLAVHQPFTRALLFLPVAVALLTFFISGATLLFATATVFFRDVKHLTEVLLQMLMYLSPVLYDLGQLGVHRTWWYGLFRAFLAVNPMTYLLPLVRDPVYFGRLPSLLTCGIASAWAFGALLVGFAVFVRLSPRHIHYL
jgi:lipopolysaccharide transport system permease protein